MNKKILTLIALFSHLRAMDQERSHYKTHILQASEITFFELFKKRQITPPYRFLEETELYSDAEVTTHNYSKQARSQSLKKTLIRRPHIYQTIFSHLSPVLVLYGKTLNNELDEKSPLFRQTVFVGNPHEFLESSESTLTNNLVSCTAILFAQKENESTLTKFFENIKAKVAIENIKKWYIKTPVTTKKEYLAIILKQNPDESYLLLHDEQTIYFNKI